MSVVHMIQQQTMNTVFLVYFKDTIKQAARLTLNQAGGSYVPAAQEIACHISQDHARVLKLLDFFKNDVGLRVKESS